MAAEAVMDAVNARIALYWSYTPIETLNDSGSVPEDGSSFLSIQFPYSTQNQITIGAIGDNVYREEGGFRVVLSAQAGTGTKPYMAWLDGLRNFLREKQFDGVCTWAPAPVVINDDNDDGAYFLMSFAVPYYFDEFA